MPGTTRTSEASTIVAPPKENALVQVRGQNWVVSGVEAAPTGDVTVVHLQSVADGRYGDTLSVIWEVEPGRRVLPAGSLPDASAGAFDPPEQLALRRVGCAPVRASKSTSPALPSSSAAFMRSQP